MSNILGPLLGRNLLEVFGQRDSARREVAIAEIYTADCTFFETEERIVGREALNMNAEQLLGGTPGFVFSAAGSAEVNHGLALLQWHLGPAVAPPIVTGMDIAFFSRPAAACLLSRHAPAVHHAMDCSGKTAWELQLLASHAK